MIKIFIGMLAGFFTALGLGGGSVLILLLTIFLKMDLHLAQSCNLIFFIFSALISIFINLKHKNINFKNSKFIILFGILGAFVGAKISKNLNSKILQKVFACFLIVIAFSELYSYYKLYIKNKIRHTKN